MALNVLRASLRTGRVTTTYPDAPEPAPERYRGRPVVDPDRCDANGACVDACPAAAIALRAMPGASLTWEVDLGRCVFCGLCVEACPTEAVAMSGEFELAARDRRDLVKSTAVRGGTTRPAVTVDEAPHRMRTGAVADAFTSRMRRLLRRSLHVRHMDAGSDNGTDWELTALLNPVYDVQRLGIDFVASPRHADLLLVTGAVTRNLEDALHRTYEAMPRPRIVVAAGADACGGGIVRGSYAVAGGVDRCLPVDVYIPGDPPRPQAIVWGLLMAMERHPRATRARAMIE